MVSGPNLVNTAANVFGGISGLPDATPSGPGITFPAGDTTTVTLPDGTQRDFAMQPTLAWIQKLYSLVIYSNGTVLDTGAAGFKPIDPAWTTTAAEYYFKVPPKTYEIAEPFATTITPTQNGGYFVESQGSLIREIKIAGTTGLRPYKKNESEPVLPILNEIPIFGEALSSAATDFSTAFSELTTDPLGRNPGRGLKNKTEVTGYDDIIKLRNLFRLYSDIKKTNQSAGTVMLWRNVKDADYWVVEPVDFRLTQNSQSPMTYGYSITLRTLSRFDYKLEIPIDPRSTKDDVFGFLQRMKVFNRELLDVFLTVSNQIDRFEGLAIDATTQLLTPMLNVIKGINTVKSTVNNVGKAYSLNINILLDNIAIAQKEMTGVDSNQIGAPGGVGGAGSSITIDTSRFETQDFLKNILRRLARVLRKMKTEPSLIDTPEKVSVQTLRSKTDAYSTPGDSALAKLSPSTGGSATFIGNEPASSSVSSTKVNQGDTIKTLARRIFGNAGRWHILVVLNSLKPPYVAEVSGPGVLGPGDDILYPSVGSTSGSQNVSGINPSINAVNTSNAEKEGTDAGLNSPVEQAYGRDIRLKSATSGADIDRTDFVINQAGDISTIEGRPNVTQALRLKFSTQRGELTVHPRYGARFPIGTKLVPSSFNDFSIQARTTLLSDSRVKDVSEMRFFANGDVLAVTASVILTQSNSILTTNIDLE